MNKTTEALKLAEKTLEDIIRVYKFETGTPVTALAAIREALAEQELYEPEGRCKECLAYNGHLDYCSKSAPVKRPQNCGTGYCSCIECPYEPVSIPDHIICPFCESDHVPDWLHDLKLDAKAIRAEALEQAAEWCDRLANNGSLDAEDCAAAIRGLK